MAHSPVPPARQALAVVLVAAIAVQGCAAISYPTAVPTKGQDAATVERDERECRERAAEQVESPLGTGLMVKVGSALAGAAFGGMAMLAVVASGSGPVDPELAGFLVGGGAALGFVVGSMIGTFAGAGEASRLTRARQDVFVRCMMERGYRLE